MIERDNTSDHAGHPDGSSTEGIDPTTQDLAWLLSPNIAGPAAAAGDLGESLLVCNHCRSRLMYPAYCEECRREQWYVELKCPECDGSRSDLFSVEMLDALDRELDRAEAEIEADLARITRGNMGEYVRRFVAALNAGAIEAEDFNPRST